MSQLSADYQAWVVQLKTRLRSMQMKAAVSVNSALLEFYSFWVGSESIAKQTASQLGADVVNRLIQIPWWHNVVIVTKCQSTQEALYYIENTIQQGWSRNVLTHQIESNLWEREGRSISNFSSTLPSPQSDLAQQTLKDPMCLIS